MFRIVTVAFLFAIISLSARSQSQPISFQITLSGKGVKSMNAHTLGDSALITYVDSDNSKTSKAFWVKPGGASREVNLDVEIFSINSYDGELYYYTFEKNKKQLYLKAIVDLPDHTRLQPSETILIEGDVIDAFADKNQFIVIHNPVAKKLVELELSRMQVINKREWNIPAHMYKQMTNQSFPLIRDRFLDNSFLGTTKAKLYRSNDGLYTLSVDDRHAVQGKRMSREEITGTHIAVLGDTTIHIIPYTRGHNRFRSWIDHGKLFRYNVDREYSVLEIVDIVSGKLIATSTLYANFTEFGVYERTGQQRPVLQKSFKDICRYSAMADPYVVVTRNEDGVYIIMNGTRAYATPEASRDAGMEFGLVGLAFYTWATRAWNDSRAIDRYYYTTFDPSSGKVNQLSIDAAKSTREKIDHYEMEAGNVPAVPKVLGYSETTNYVFGYYYLGKKQVQFSWFPTK